VGIKLAAESVVRQGELFLALDARRDERSPAREALVRVASAIDVDWLERLFPQSIMRERTAMLDESRGTVVGRATTRYLDLPLRESDDVAVDTETAERVLADHLTPERLRDLILADENARRWVDRVELLKKVMPNQSWPSLWSDDFAREIAQSAVRGKRTLATVSAALADALRGMLQYPLDRLLDSDAPELIEVPTGNHIRLEYPSQSDRHDEIAPPVLAVRLQEMFGLADTPRIAGGRVAVVLHLLGPNYRPVQITRDLRSFWATTYAQVRKDLKARYPKHSWPDDPLTAPPQARGGRWRT
ncbi:MAG: ATP-dependent helicase HrpB, partial [Chthoniobacterales bacterium]|nr:ATP-dependent helicase HrpB [Chthoniobacterales bacterium]